MKQDNQICKSASHLFKLILLIYQSLSNYWKKVPACSAWKADDPSKRRLTSVNVRMLLHVRLLVEPLAAVLAGVRPGVRVDKKMRGQGGGAFERLATHLALEAFFLIEDKRETAM